MDKHKLILLLKTFSKAENRAFKKYLSSPFFNENQTLVRLFQYISKGLEVEEIPSKTQIWRALFPKQGYNDLRFRRLFSDLSLLAQNFLAYQIYKENPISERNHMLRALNDRNLDKHFKAIERGTRQMQDSLGLKNANYYLNQSILEQNLDNFLIKHVEVTKTVNLEATDRMLDCFYLSKKLKNYCNALNYKNVLNLDLQLGLVQQIVPHLEASGYLEVPAIAIYYQIMQTLLDPEEDRHFHQLVRLLDQDGHVFTHQETREMYIFAQNYCIRQINFGNVKFFRELFVIYQTLLEKGIIYDGKGKLLPWDYKNIVTLGLRLSEFDWIEAFIRNYNVKLPEKFQENALTYNLANLHFHQRRYDQVISLLSEVEYRDLYYALDGRWLLIKTYYELNELDAIDSLLESFRIFLLRNKLLSSAKQRQYLNLVRFVKRLIRLGESNTKKASVLAEKIRQAKEVAERKWLMEKLEELF